MSEISRREAFGEDDLAAAVAEGIVTPEQATALAALVARRRDDRGAGVDEEEVRFVTSFNDVYVTLGAVLLLGGVAAVAARVGFGPAALAALVTGWGLSELFARRWRMAFPSIVLTLAVVGAAGGVGAAASDLLGVKSFEGIFAGAVATAVGYAHWRRFAVPISVAAAAAGLVVLLLVVITAAIPPIADSVVLVMLPLGLGVFALAMWWDASDLLRRTRRTDVAFWLHILAAPMIVHPAVSAAGLGLTDLTPTGAALILAIFAVLAFVALVVDRRALLVSTLVYLGVSIGVLIERFGWSTDLGGALTIGLVGAVVLFLAVVWRPLRGQALRLTPAFVQAIVPPPAMPERSRP